MDSINNVISVPAPAPLPRPRSGGASVPILPKKSSEPAIRKAEGSSVESLERRRLERVKLAAQDIANTFVLGDSRFTIFKDATGQYITRFTSLRDGRVTYIPEPQLLHNRSSAPAVSLNV